MAGRIQTMRKKLFEELKSVGAPGGWDHIINQIGMPCLFALLFPGRHGLTHSAHAGMFSFTGLTKVSAL